MMIIMRITILALILSLIGCISPNPTQAENSPSSLQAQAGVSHQIATDCKFGTNNKYFLKKIGVATLPNAPSFGDNTGDFRYHYFIPYWQANLEKTKYLFEIKAGNFICPSQGNHKELSTITGNTGNYPVIKLPKKIDDICKQNSQNGLCILGGKPSFVEDLLEQFRDVLKTWEIKDGIDINLNPLAGGTAETPQKQPPSPQALPDILKTQFGDVADKMTIDGCGKISLANQQLQAENCNEGLKNKSLVIPNFDKIELDGLKEDKFNKLKFTVKMKLGETDGEFHFPIEKLAREPLCFEIKEGKLCTKEKVSAKQVVESQDKPLLLEFTVAEKPNSSDSQSTEKIGTHKLIVVSLSKLFGDGGRGGKINAVLKSIVDTICNEQNKQKFLDSGLTLLSIESGRQLDFPLNTMDKDKFCSSPTSLKELQFGVEDSNFIDNLELVDGFIVNLSQKSKKVGHILYLTESGLWDSVSRRQLGIPLAWENDNIHLHVITVEKCEPWQKRAQASCVEWNPQDDATLSKEVKKFLLIQ